MAGLLSLSEALTSTLHKQKGDCLLVELGDDDAPAIGFASGLAFQYFPDSIHDSKKVNYSAKDIIGGSLPIYQWVNSGARVISFNAIFSCDNDLISESAPSGLNASLISIGENRRNVDIRSAVLWLRHYMFPRYGESGTGATVPKPPRKLYLQIPGSGIGLAGMGSAAEPDSVTCIMTQCEVVYNAFFPSNLPRMATVSLVFEQVPQLKGKISFPANNTDFDALIYAGTKPSYSKISVNGENVDVNNPSAQIFSYTIKK